MTHKPHRNRRKIGLGVGLMLLIGSANSAKAGFLDESECKNGAFISNSGLSGAISDVDRRVVACFNYQNTILKSVYEEFSSDIAILKSRINLIEIENKRLKAEIEALKSK
ncbi:hypothetical protein [Pinisolibacter sp.]|uniref:hypothetical protein n=1 Tax=Pinisolibacter sp. TaxID=2172024 RepID=UPI002FDCEBFD